MIYKEILAFYFPIKLKVFQFKIIKIFIFHIMRVVEVMLNIFRII